MKCTIRLLILVFIISFSTTYGQGKFGLGIILGEPTGISAKVKVSSTTAFDGAIAWSFVNEGALHIHADLLLHTSDLISKVLPIYYGIGGRIKFRKDETRLGIRIPIGIVYDIPFIRIDLFGEIVPLLNLNPSTNFTMNAAVGGRFYF